MTPSTTCSGGPRPEVGHQAKGPASQISAVRPPALQAFTSPFPCNLCHCLKKPLHCNLVGIFKGVKSEVCTQLAYLTRASWPGLWAKCRFGRVWRKRPAGCSWGWEEGGRVGLLGHPTNTTDWRLEQQKCILSRSRDWESERCQRGPAPLMALRKESAGSRKSSVFAAWSCIIPVSASSVTRPTVYVWVSSLLTRTPVIGFKASPTLT